MFKRLLLTVCFLFFASNAFAAWTITETIDADVQTKQSDIVVIKLRCTSDTSSTDYKLLNQTAIRGYYYYGMRTDPDGTAAPTGTYDVDVEDELNFHIHDTDAHSTTAVEFTRASSTINAYWPVFSDISVVIATLGDTKITDIYLIFVK